MVPEAMRAAWILKHEFGYETRIVNLHTLKPIDQAAFVWAAKETSVSSRPRSTRSAPWLGA